MADVHRLSGMWSFVGVFSLSSILCTLYLTNTFVGLPLKQNRSLDDFVEVPKDYLIQKSPSCLPKTNIFFLKTHKCASSTVQNVFMRYGMKRKLNFVLPTSDTGYLGNQTSFSRLLTLEAPWSSLGFNIFCHHTVFDDEEVKSLMPSDTIYVSIMRDPVDLFESLYSYSNLELHYNQSIEDFAKTRKATLATFLDRADGHLGVNQMLFDFGVRPAEFGVAAVVQQTMKDVERRFSLIMMAEHFDESMILLQDLLCWTLDDIVYFVHNARQNKMRRHLSAGLRDSLKKLNDGDRTLYVHFRQLFWRRVRLFGFRRMRSRVAALRKRVLEFKRFCVRTTTTAPAPNDNDLQDSFPFHDVVEDISVIKGNATCSQLAMREFEFTKRLKMKQMERVLRQGLMG